MFSNFYSIMANLGHHTHALCLITMVMSEGLCLSISTQRMPSLRDLFLIRFVDHFDQRFSPYLTDSSPLHCRFPLVLSIQWNYDFLPRRRFGSGAFPCRRWFFRFSTGVFTWVFDPGINRVLGADEDITNLVEMKTIRQAQWFIAGALVSLFVVVEDVNYVSDLSVSNRQTDKSRTLIWMFRREASYMLTGFRNPKPPGIFLSFNVLPMFFNCFIRSSSIWGVDVQETTSSHLWAIGFLSHLKNKHLIKWDNLIVGTSDRLRFCKWWCLFTANSSSLELPASVYFLQWEQSWGRRLFINLCVWIGISRTKERAKVSFFILLPSQRYHYVVFYISELQVDTLNSKRFAKIKFSHVMLHSNRLREKSNLKWENSSSSDRKASSNSTVFFLVYGTYNCVCNYLCYCIISL